MNKVIFLDIDGVLNSDRSLYKDVSLEDDLILNLKELVDKTQAKIILSSSWRDVPSAIKYLMDKLDSVGLHLSGMTGKGMEVEIVERLGFTPTKRYLGDEFGFNIKDSNQKYQITYDRGAEILNWLFKHDDCNYVILDDDDFDIIPYFKKKVIIKTSYKTGLTKEDVKKAIKVLTK